MDDALCILDELTAVVETEHEAASRFIVASHYKRDLSAEVKLEIKQEDADNDKDEEEDDDDDEEFVLTSTSKRRIVSRDEPKGETIEVSGTWTVTLGCGTGWWSLDLHGRALHELISGSAPLSKAAIQTFAHSIRSAFDHQSITFDTKFTHTTSVDSDPLSSIRLSIDVDTFPIELTLARLSAEDALASSTRLLLSRIHPDPHKTPRAASRGTSSFELHQLQRKLEATQQALREERHKYRSLLAAPSAATARAGRRPVVGLGPSLVNGSQRSQALPPSSPSHGHKSRSGMPSSSSSNSGAGPSSDDTFSVQDSQRSMSQRSVSQRMTSLINPTRVRRADPSENDGFVGDDD